MATRICKCNTCEAVFDRTVKYIGKMFTDQECTLCVEATACAFAVLSQEALKGAVFEILKKEGKLTGEAIVDSILVSAAMDRAQNVIAKDMTEVWEKDGERIIRDLNVYVKAAAEVRRKEQELPKDT